jgi:BirA family biotin operon repressor/biotin-[acetyl-CoA-carboxylase] ligase
MAMVPWTINEFEEIDSTNSWLVARAKEGAPHGTVARADFQTAGRGRLDRTWEAPRGVSLLTSILLTPRVSLEQLPVITASVALAASRGLTRLCGLSPKVKWPNDLIVNDRKLGGILAELVDVVEGSPRIVVGLGLNLQWPGPEGVGGTCVRDEVGVTVTPRAMLDILLAELEPILPLCESEEGRRELAESYRDILATLGRTVRVEMVDGSSLVGVVTDVDEDGALRVRVDGTEVAVRSGDVFHLRESVA